MSDITCPTCSEIIHNEEAARLEEECKKWKRLAEAPPCEAVQAGDRWYKRVINWVEVDK